MSTVAFGGHGRRVTVHPSARIEQAESIWLGDWVVIDDFVFILGGRETRIGSHVRIALGSSLAGGGELEIGDFCLVSAGVRIWSGNHDYGGATLLGPGVPEPFQVIERSRVEIGRHCMIGTNSVVLPGVTIGEGVTVGALSLVNEDLPAWTVCCGIPARPVRERPKAAILELERRVREQARV